MPLEHRYFVIPLALFTLALPAEGSALWNRDFSGSPRDDASRALVDNLERENVGTHSRIHGVFDRWILRESVRGDRGTHYAELTKECRGKIELRYALEQSDYARPEKRAQYFRDIDALIGKVGEQLLADHAAVSFGAEERTAFLRALRALAWQESHWQHYVRFKNSYFVILSGGSYNQLDDWGISQIARSGFDPKELMNQDFFQQNGHCSLSSSLYFGFLEYYEAYLQARTQPCNGRSTLDKLVGAYNSYSSGYGTCHADFSPDWNYRDYQEKALAGFRGHFENRSWRAETGAQ